MRLNSSTLVTLEDYFSAKPRFLASDLGLFVFLCESLWPGFRRVYICVTKLRRLNFGWILGWLGHVIACIRPHPCSRLANAVPS